MRVGVVGLGARISGVINHTLANIEPDIKVVGVVDPDEQGARSRLSEQDRDKAVFYNSFEEMVKKGKLDALAIGTRCNLHTSYAIKAAKHSIPLFLEKPVSINMEQAIELEKAFENSKCEVVVGFGLKASPLCRFVKEKLENGAVGNPEHIMAWNYVPYGTVYWEQPYRDYSITQGLFLQKATHDFDYISYLMGSPIVRVGAMATFMHIFGGTKEKGLKCSECKETDTCLESPTNRKLNGSGHHTKDHMCVYSVDCGSLEEGTNEDSSSALLEFASGAHGVYTQVFYTRRDAAARGATISGYHGTLRFDWYENEIKYVRHHKPFSDTIKSGDVASHFGGDNILGINFINIVKNKEKSIASIQDGIQSVYACLAAKESLVKNRMVKIRQVGQV
ncbi:Gfo/Idh/MocA family oxidoreductase [bacterium]|nr:Gfo/Idh/MocA family oxidoreductase [bacterium]